MLFRVKAAMKIQILLLGFVVMVTAGCRVMSEDSQTESVPAGLITDDKLNYNNPYGYLSAGQCMIEVKRPYRAEPVPRFIPSPGSISYLNGAQCVPFPNIVWRGRMDVSTVRPVRDVKVQPLAVSMLIDNSYSLTETDPTKQRYVGLINSLKELAGIYAKQGQIKVQVIMFDYCTFKTWTANDVGGIANIIRNIEAHSRSADGAGYGSTNYLESFDHAYKFLKQFPNFSQHMLVFTDGMPWTLNSGITSQCQFTNNQITPTLDPEDPRLLNCAKKYLHGEYIGKCRRPSPSDLGWRPDMPNKQAWYTPANYAVGMARHLGYLNNDIKRWLPKLKIHSIYLQNLINGKCYTGTDLNKNRDPRLVSLCKETAKKFFTKVSNGLLLMPNKAPQLKQSFAQFTRSILQQVGFHSVGYQLLPLDAGQGFRPGKLWSQPGDPYGQLYNFETQMDTYFAGANPAGANLQGDLLVAAGGNAPGAFKFNTRFSFAIPPNYDAFLCGYNAAKPGLIVDDHFDYRVTCRVGYGTAQCVDGDRIVEAGKTSTVYSKSLGSKSLEIEETTCEQNELICINGQWYGQQVAVPYEVCGASGIDTDSGTGKIKNGKECTYEGGKTAKSGDYRYSKSKGKGGDAFICSENQLICIDGGWHLAADHGEVHELCDGLDEAGYPIVSNNPPVYGPGNPQLPNLPVPPLVPLPPIKGTECSEEGKKEVRKMYASNSPDKGETCDQLLREVNWTCAGGYWISDDPNSHLYAPVCQDGCYENRESGSDDRGKWYPNQSVAQKQVYSKSTVSFSESCDDYLLESKQVCSNGEWTEVGQVSEVKGFATCKQELPKSCEGGIQHNTLWTEVRFNTNCDSKEVEMRCYDGKIEQMSHIDYNQTKCKETGSCGQALGYANSSYSQTCHIISSTGCKEYTRECTETGFNPLHCPGEGACPVSEYDTCTPGQKDGRLRFEKSQLLPGEECKSQYQERVCVSDGTWGDYFPNDFKESGPCERIGGEATTSASSSTVYGEMLPDEE